MTRKERRNPGLLDGSRRRRIAAGAGVQVQDVNKLMKQFMEMQKMMKSMGGGRMKRMLQAFKGGMPRVPRSGSGRRARVAGRETPLSAQPFTTGLRRIRALFWPAGTGNSPRGYAT